MFAISKLCLKISSKYSTFPETTKKKSVSKHLLQYKDFGFNKKRGYIDNNRKLNPLCYIL